MALFLHAARSADLPAFRVGAEDVAYIVLDAEPREPWILSITLTEQKLKEYEAFTAANIDNEISLVIAGTEIYRPVIKTPVKENPLTFRMFEKEKFLAILSALPDDPK